MFDRPELFIAGTWVAPLEGGSIEVVSPSTGEVVGAAAAAGAKDADSALSAAVAVSEDGTWARADVEERIDVVRRAMVALQPKLADVVDLVTHEMGVPVKMSRALHGQKLVASVDWACESARQLAWRSERHGAVPAVVYQEAAGPVVAIAPWNGPFVQSTYKIVYPLLAGCPVVYKPSPETPLSAFYLAEAFAEAGLPDGLLSIVPGGRDLGRYLVEHPATAAVFFTGSTAAGREIGAACGRDMKRAVLELGGKSAAIVREDADLDLAAPLLAGGIFGNSGQNCAATSRVLVAESRFDEVVERFVAAARSLKVGDPFDESTDLGPVITEQQLQRIQGYIASAEAEGGSVVTGGGRVDRPGWFLEPTVVTGLDNTAAAVREEIFGPVVCVIPTRSDEEAIALANDNEYGLHGTVYTQDLRRADWIARRVRTGTMSVNSFVINSEAPFGGVKASGIGRKYGIEGLSEFLQPKTVNLGAAAATFDFR